MTWKAYKVNELIAIPEFFSFFKIHYDHDFAFKGESHNFWECLYVAAGTVCVSADERIYNLHSGDIIFHKPLELHKFYINDMKGADIIVFSFSLEGELSDYFRNKVFCLTQLQKEIVAAMLHYIQTKQSELAIPKAARVYREYLYPFTFSKTYSQMVVTYLYQLLLSLADNGMVTQVSDSTDANLFRTAVDYMNSNICEQCTVTDIAAFCNVSEASLKRIFDKYAGIGVHKYYLQLKIKTATRLLKDGCSVSETAQRLGFSSQGYFSAAYKRETGQSPSHV